MALRISVCLSVYLFVCQLQVGVLSKWLNLGSNKQRHTIAQGFELANANSRSRSLYAIARPFVVCRQSVCCL